MNQTKHTEEKWQWILLMSCLLVGLLLRVGNPADWSFINDELSTWSKVSYDSVWGVIDNIKAVDSHPVGMYVFVYYWTGIFGTSEWAIKFPFLLMSLASMVLVYRIASIWFSRTVGLMALAYFASLQFPIWWSLIARQYQSGLFCTLLMAYYWTKLMIEQEDKKRYWIGFVLMGAAAMYNHYFSLIFAGVIGLSGFLWMRRAILWKYIGAGIAMVALFAPHISLTNYQLLHADGHKWYNIPTPSFFPNHIFYCFHYSYWCLGLIVGMVLGGSILYANKRIAKQNKQRLTALLWFATPLLFGYFYSVYYSPILRESHLLFSFPYLLMLLLSIFPPKLANGQKIALVVAILAVNSYTLIATRSHFQTIHTHPYEHFVQETKAFLEKHNPEEVTIVLGENPLYLQYYKDLYGSDFKHVESFKPHLSFFEMQTLLKNAKGAYCIVGNLPEAHVHMAMDYYPYLYKKRYGINYEYYILTKNKEEGQAALEVDFNSKLTFEEDKVLDGWEYNSTQIQQDSMSGNAFFAMQGVEWGPTFSMPMSAITPRHNEFLDIGVDVRIEDSVMVENKGILVLEIRNEQDSLLLWKGVDALAQTTTEKGWQRLYLSVRFAHEPFYKNVKKLKMKTFFWNREKQAVQLDRFIITTRKGNLLLYGDTNDFRRLNAEE